MAEEPSRVLALIRRIPSRLGVRLLAVNVVVVCVPIFGIEFARLFERRLLDALERLWALSLRIWHLVLDRVAALPAAVDEQRALLAALVAGDAPRAGARMREHVQAFETEILDAFSR